MKTRNILLGVVLVFIFAVAAGLFFIINSLDSLVESAIEKYASEATQTTVRVDGVNILLQEGGGVIKGITIANPDGFSDPHVFTLGEINIRIDVSTLMEDAIVIEEVRIHVPEIFYEINQQGKANLNILKENLAGDGSKQPVSKENNNHPDDAEPRLVIKRFILDSGNVKATIMPMQGQIKQASLSRLELSNIGGKGGSTAREISRQLVKNIIEHALLAVAQQGIEKYLSGDVNKGLASKFIDNLQQLGAGED